MVLKFLLTATRMGKKNSLMSAMITALMFSIKSDPVVRKKEKRVCVCVCMPAAELYDPLVCVEEK